MKNHRRGIMKEYYVNYQNKRLFFEVPDGWEVILFHEFAPPSKPFDPKEKIRKALDNPIGSMPLEEMIKPGMQVAVLFDDLQRATPVDMVLSELIPKVLRAGAREKDLLLICAPGTHPVPSLEALKKKIGNQFFERFKERIFAHDPHSKANYPIGRTTWGLQVEINPYVASADLVIGIGECTPHPCAGYGGGSKIIMPGICSYKTVAQHHLSWMRHYSSRVGLLNGNPFYEEIVEVGRLARLSFKIDVVLDEKGGFFNAFAGDPVLEHKEASAYLETLYGLPIPEFPDVTIVSAHPLETGVQATKALNVASVFTKPGGIILWVSPQTDPQALRALGEELKKVEDISEFQKKILKEEIPEYFLNLSVSYIMQVIYFKSLTARFKVVNISEGVDKNLIENLGFAHFSTLDEALSHFRKEIPKAKVAIIPSGGYLIPKIGWL
jgi:nickel-dependent lactate racemase